MHRYTVFAMAAAVSAGLLLSPTTLTAASATPLSSFPEAGKTWKDKFAVSKIPTNKFQAYYFNTRTGAVAKREIVSSVDVNYVHNEGDGFKIYSEDFGGFWIGKFTTKKVGVMQLDIAQSWSHARVVVDGRVVYTGSDMETVLIKMPKGTHVMEVEYENNWHTTGFTAALRPVDDVPPAITGKTTLNSKSVVWYAGAYESRSFDRTIELTSSVKDKTPKILVLASYSPVKWDLAELKGVPVEAILVSSFEPGSRVLNGPKKAKVYSASIEYAYNGSCDSYDTGCAGRPGYAHAYMDTYRAIGKPVSGFIGEYATESLTLPGIILTSKY